MAETGVGRRTAGKAELPVAGQRWLSHAEPELGLGFVLAADAGTIQILFPAAEERRVYALASAPLKRMRYAEGDRIIDREGRRLVVESVEEADGLLTYLTAEGAIAEAELSETISYSSADQRLLAGQSDTVDQFDLRHAVLRRTAAWRKTQARGFTGPRMDLIAHQLAIASEVCSRLRPRVLLSDEVGLGKTIEACLILHQLLLSGRIRRVLILVPDMLVHQWFIELLRRFSLNFSIFDDDRFAASAAATEDNPFHDEQLILGGVDSMLTNPRMAEALRTAEWDMLVVDEAHHLEWSETASSPAYDLVEALAERADGLLLLTATPQQLGLAGHFARLRLLDPERYPSLADFKVELEQYEALAKWLESMEAYDGGTELELAAVPPWDPQSSSWQRYCKAWPAGLSKPVTAIIHEVLEAFGPGRDIFRNTRARLSGFPGRKVHLEALEVVEDGTDEATRLDWLLQLMKQLKQDKVLLICRTRETADALVEAIARQSTLNVAAFHEQMSLMQRDRAAAYFADPEGGRLLICSEIGSEGRNFQFAHHLVLWDLPLEPDLIEQRIGRLDRIGQKQRIHIHVPFIKGTLNEIQARWYHEGLGIFSAHVPGAHQLGEATAELWRPFAEGQVADAAAVDALISETRRLRKQIQAKLRDGRDRLLETTQREKVRGDLLAEALQGCDEDIATEDFLVDIFEEIGVQVHEDGPRCYHLEPIRLASGTLPFLPQSGVFVTFERATALAREDVPFLSLDHPMVEAAMEVFLAEGRGNCACAIWQPTTAGTVAEGVFLELIFVTECVAPAHLHLDRFFPATPLRLVVDHSLELVEPQQLWHAGELSGVKGLPILDRKPFRQRLFPAMLEAARTAAEPKLNAMTRHARQSIHDKVDAEIERLELLEQLNGSAFAGHAAALRDNRDRLLDVLDHAQLRLDAVRLVWRGRA